MKNLLAVFMIAATGNVAAEDCALVGLMAETVMQSRQYGWGIQLYERTELQKKMVRDAGKWVVYQDSNSQYRAARDFKREWVEACERGVYDNKGSND